MLDTEVVGFYALEWLDPSRAEVDALFVDPPFIGRGIGRLLMEHAIGVARKADCNLLIIQSDPFAVPFYEAIGAERAGQRDSASIAGRALPMYHLHLE